jgi:hypothetical protein
MVTYIAVIIILMKPINTYLLKKWIGNERRKRILAERMQDENLSDTESVDVKGPPMKRMSSGYNIFTSKMLSSGTRYYYDYNYNFPTRCSITYFNTCMFKSTTTHASNSVRSQPENVLLLCKFQIIIIIHFFRNSLFLQSMDTEIFA